MEQEVAPDLHETGSVVQSLTEQICTVADSMEEITRDSQGVKIHSSFYLLAFKLSMYFHIV